MAMKTAPKPLQWWLRLIGFKAITLPPLGIYVLPGAESDSLKRHEQAHWQQYERHGLIGFYARYAWYSIRYGYTNNPMEIEARRAEQNLS